MYRDYENPYRLEDTLQELKKEYELLKWDSKADPEDLVRLKEEIEELRQRINFAWQDHNC